MAVTKSEFVRRMAEKSGIKKVEAERAAELFIGTLIDCLRENGCVKFSRFGKFEVKTMKEKEARNPNTGESCIVPEHKKVKFCSSEKLAGRIGE